MTTRKIPFHAEPRQEERDDFYDSDEHSKKPAKGCLGCLSCLLFLIIIFSYYMVF